MNDAFRLVASAWCLGAVLELHAAQVPNPTLATKLAGKNVCVLVAAKQDHMTPFAAGARSRMEMILRDDNHLSVLDRDTSEKLRDVARLLDDPQYVVDARLLAKMEQYKVHVMFWVNLTGEAVPGPDDYSTATANASVRTVITETAVVDTNVLSSVMGTPSIPSSDGTTKESALTEAVYRAVEDICLRMGLDLAPTPSTYIQLAFVGPVSGVTAEAPSRRPENDPMLRSLARFYNETCRKESATCTARDPSGKRAAVGGYIRDTTLGQKGRQMDRKYASRVHVLDLSAKSEFNVFDCHELGMRGMGTRKVLDCMFVSNWRYLAAVTGYKLFFWDIERGRLLCSMEMVPGYTAATLGFAKAGPGENYLVVRTSSQDAAGGCQTLPPIAQSQTLYYRIVRQQQTKGGP